MAKVLMIQGTASNAGKSVITAALLRIFKQDGYKAAPFKSQNMALNSYVTRDGFEIGRAQAMQAEAAGIPCDVRMNPILLKPTGKDTSQVILMGKPVGDMTAAEYFKAKDGYVKYIKEAYESLASENDIIVIEGAGSPAEINLNHNDFVNMGMAEIASAPVFIVGDIDRGGVFASLYGTVMLTPEKYRDYIKGMIINKFRGDVELLKPGLDMIESLTGVKVAGVVPYKELKLDDEDGLTERFEKGKPGLTKESDVGIAVIKLPHISNFTDFNPFEYAKGVSLRYIESTEEIKNCDMLILPGSKNTMSDLEWLKQKGFAAAVKDFARQGKAVFGVCGGYQMLGKRISDPYCAEQGGDAEGLCLLDIETVFAKEKITEQVSGKAGKIGGVFSSLSGCSYKGYEIHMGKSGENPVITGENNVYGTYVHGLFDSYEIVSKIVNAIRETKGQKKEKNIAIRLDLLKEKQYYSLADTVRTALDMSYIYEVIDNGIR